MRKFIWLYFYAFKRQVFEQHFYGFKIQTQVDNTVLELGLWNEGKVNLMIFFTFIFVSLKLHNPLVPSTYDFEKTKSTRKRI